MQQASALHRAGGEMAGEQAQMTQGIQAGRANEMAVASGQLATAAQGVRAEDLNAADLQQKAELAQRQLNQQDQQYYEGLGYNTNAAQLAANQNAQREADAREGGNISGTQQASDFSFGKGVQLVGMAAGAATGGAGSALAAAAKGGHIGGEHPYLVGEKGPELVVPDKPGFVYTAAQTAALRGAPPTDQQIAARPELARLAPPRAFGGPMSAYGPDSMTDADPMAGYGPGELGQGGAGGLVQGTIGHENRLITGAFHPSMSGMSGYTREDGGPIHAEEKGFAAGFRAAVAEHINALRSAAAEAIAPATPAPVRQPREAVIIDSRQGITNGRRDMPVPHTLEVTHPNTAPAVVSSAPVGMVSAPVVEAARACGGPMYARPRAEGGPVDNFMTPDERDAAGDPYERPPELGAMGAPRGYAASREGQAGSITAPAPVTHGYEPMAPAGGAPGTADWQKYGAPAVNDKDPNWKRGGATTAAGAGADGGNWISRLLLGINGGMQPSPHGGYVR